MKNANYTYNLENRLINFAVSVIQLVQKMPNSPIAKHLGGQLNRSATSPALNYGEAQAAESTKDFLHKMKICLKELRESQICLKIIKQVPLLSEKETHSVFDECCQLVAIFTKSVQTSEETLEKEKMSKGKT